MKRHGWGLRLVFLVAAALALAGANRILPRTVELRDRYQLMSRPASEGVPPEYILTSSLLGGFRGLFLTSLWIRAQEMKNDGKFYEMVDIYNVITKLEPNYANAWAFQAWDLSFNVSVEYQQDLTDRVYWVFRGVELLRNQGIPKNPDVSRLYSELAWIFFFKIGKDMDDAYLLYRQHLARQMNRVLLGTGATGDLEAVAKIRQTFPTRESLLANAAYTAVIERFKADGVDLFASPDVAFGLSSKTAQAIIADPAAKPLLSDLAAWVVGERIKTELHMDAEVMLDLNRRFGEINWLQPQAHSLYWGWLGQKAWEREKPEEMSLTHERMIYFSLILMAYRGQIFASESGAVYGAPDYRFLKGISDYIDERLAYYQKAYDEGRTTMSLSGFQSGYENFLRSAVFNAYLENNREQASEILQRLRKTSAWPEKYTMPLDKFVEQEFQEWIADMPKDQAVGMIASYTMNAWRALAMQDDREYQYHRNWAEYLHAYGKKRWDVKDNPNEVKVENLIPPLEDIELMTLTQVMMGEAPLGPYDLRGILAQIVNTRRPDLWKKVEDAMREKSARSAIAPASGQGQPGASAAPATPEGR